MEDFSNSVMIALLPTSSDWCRIELPHMTLVYAGEIGEDLTPSDFNALAKDAASIAQLSAPIFLKVSGVEEFGDTDKVDVLRLSATPELLAMRSLVEHWDASEYPFNPHATIGPAGSFLEFPPMYLSFDRIMVGWGEEQLVFWLRRSS